ncbi:MULTISPECIES: hypothetical protein [unclassified Streptomyces]|uniref:hypothetical protein n=1 Tax=unclassified Streptomyces TaxID=2593676 RepID=UPI001B35CE7C|nr:hypothetical protein [Streptomyces sp. RK76]MBQ0949260.1 hypothetical protein [Streptomyces sp. RK76]
MEHTSGVGPDGWKGRGEFTSPDELIVLSVDYGDEDYHIDAKPGHRPADMKAVLAQARARGLEPMDADECEPELLEDGTVRIYLVLAEVPVEAPAVTVTPLPVKRTSKRLASAFAIAAALLVGVLVPTPLRAVYPHMPTFGGDEVAESTVPPHQHDPITQSVFVQTKGN